MITASIYGRLARDPEVRETKSGNAMCTASLSVDVTPYGHHGDSITAWFSVTAFGSVSEALARHVKGDMVAINGKVTLSKWVTKEGTERETSQILADSLASARTFRPGGGVKGEKPAAPTSRERPFVDDALPEFGDQS